MFVLFREKGYMERPTTLKVVIISRGDFVHIQVERGRRGSARPRNMQRRIVFKLD